MGLLFDVLREVVESILGEDGWDEAIERAGVDGAYTAHGEYADADLVRLVEAVAVMIGVDADTAWVLAGRQGLPLLAGRHPELVDGQESWMDVVERLDDLIHPEVRRTYPAASVPSFTMVERHARVVRIDYRSERSLCRLAEGFLLGLGDRYGTALTVLHESCRRRGDARCRLHVAEPGGRVD